MYCTGMKLFVQLAHTLPGYATDHNKISFISPLLCYVHTVLFLSLRIAKGLVSLIFRKPTLEWRSPPQSRECYRRTDSATFWDMAQIFSRHLGMGYQKVYVTSKYRIEFPEHHSSNLAVDSTMRN